MKGRDSKRDDYIVFAHNSQRQNSDQLPKITVENEEYVVAIIPLTHNLFFSYTPFTNKGSSYQKFNERTASNNSKSKGISFDRNGGIVMIRKSIIF